MRLLAFLHRHYLWEPRDARSQLSASVWAQARGERESYNVDKAQRHKEKRVHGEPASVRRIRVPAGHGFTLTCSKTWLGYSKQESGASVSQQTNMKDDETDDNAVNSKVNNELQYVGAPHQPSW